MRPGKRIRVAGAAVASVEAALGFPVLGTVLASYLWACAAVTVLVALVAARLLDRGGGDDDDDGGGGGGGGRRPQPPEPPWWPEFERQLREYERDRHFAGSR